MSNIQAELPAICDHLQIMGKLPHHFLCTWENSVNMQLKMAILVFLPGFQKGRDIKAS
jgi:hypothetical protein